MAVDTVTSRDGTRIEVTSEGTGPGVVILHGAGVTHQLYERLARRLGEHCTVHRYNRRGRPGTAPLRGDETPATDLDDLSAVLAGTGASAVFGHSGGAFVAMQAGLHLPQVRRIAVYDPAVAVRGCDFPRDFVGPFEEALAAGDNSLALALLSRDVNRDQLATKLPFRMQQLIVRGYLRTPIGRHMAELLPTTGPELRRIHGAEGPASQYSHVSARVLLARGARSARYYGPICTELAAAIPGARSIVISRCSHNAANIAPARFVQPFAEFLAAPS